MVTKVYSYTVDSHMHLMEMEKKGLDTHEILKESFAKGLEFALDAGVSEKDFEKRLNYKKDFPNLLFASGIHPSEAKNINSQLDIIDKQLSDNNVIAVGETGLDFHWDTVPSKTQKELFSGHIALSNKHNLPLIIHNRLADKEILEILKLEKPLAGGIIHCFSSNNHFAQKFLDLGLYISFAGNITYKKSDEIRDAAEKMPFDKILVETDAPYLSPQKMRGKLNHQGNIFYIIDCIADLFNKGADETAFQIYKNFSTLFNLKIE